MKAFEGKNFYDILNLPMNAGPAEIKRAYLESVEMYEENSLATYALFTDEQRENLLQIIKEAFQILSNEEKRAEYNRMLISTGQAEAAMFARPHHEPAQEGQPAQTSSEPREPAATEPYSKIEKFREIMDTITEEGLVSGENLKQLREARGISITEIFQKTRISRTTLGNIEQNHYEELPAEVFLKSFLKSYAEILQIDPKQIVDGYLKYKELWPGGKNYILNLQQGVGGQILNSE